MLEVITNNKLKAILFHLVLGFIVTLPGIPKLYGFLIVFIGFLIVFFSNKDEEALLISAYVVGVEVFLRMTKGNISYEIGKYAVILILLIGFLNGNTKQRPSLGYFIYILLLLLGIVFTQVPAGESIRKAIVFNLSGPFVLGIASIYMGRREVTLKKFYDILFFMLLPLLSMITYLYFKTPDLKTIVFGGVSNFEASGGFGPNQVSTAIGVGMFLIATFIFTKSKLTGFLILDGILLAYFTYRALLTFSRGGVFTAAISLGVFSYFIIRHQKISFQNVFKYVSIMGVLILGVWLYTSDVTGGMIDNRYSNRNARGIKKTDASAGRLDIFKNQIESFYESPIFGIGVGNGKYRRIAQGKTKATASHNEVSRLIEEHGSIGIIILIILFFNPLSHFRSLNKFQKAYASGFFLIWFLTINHSAMRIALPGFVYGLSLLKVNTNE